MILTKNTSNQIKTIHNYFDLRHPKRYSTLQFPGYRHIPGMTPHPVFDQQGHSFGKSQLEVIEISKNNWSINEPYLFAIDLFNYGYFWESHEHLEDFWKVSSKLQEKSFIQGLIQLSAAYLKWVQGLDEGFHKLSSKGLKKILLAQKLSPNVFGIDIISFIDANTKFLNSNDLTNSNPPVIELNNE